MLMTRERRPAIRTMRGWAIDVLQEAGAIQECEAHGWMQDRADPHARQRALLVARQEPPPGVTPDEVASVWPDAQEFGYRDESEAFLLQ